MALSAQSRLVIPYTSEAFPPGTTANGSSSLSVSWSDLLWAALTIGRPSVHHIFQHGTASLHEAIFRLSLIRMALDQSSARATRLRRSEAYKGLDPTEKGAISYFLGMTLYKVFSTRLLQTPWLLHLDVFGSMFAANNLGRSRPDLFGQQIGTGNWLSFETKGRASKPSAADVAKAKVQASRLVSIGGSPCTLHVGSFAYFLNDTLNFHWIDPPSEGKRPLEIQMPGEAWRFYFEPARALWRVRSEEKPLAAGGMTVPVPDLDLTLKVHPLLEPYFMLAAWEPAQQAMFEASQELIADGFQPDGLKIECGPSWYSRFGGDRIFEG